MKTLVYKGVTYQIKKLEELGCLAYCSLSSICKELKDKGEKSLCETELCKEVKYFEYLVKIPIYDLLSALQEDNTK